jgi:hypothetical protein
LVIHLVKLVDQAGSLVCQDKSTTLESPFACHRIFSDTRSQTDSTRTLACGEHSSMGSLLDVFQKLGFGRSGVSKEKDVDVSTDPVFPVDVLGVAAKERERDRSLDILVAIDRWSNRLYQPLSDTFVAAQSSNSLDVFLSETERRE